VARHALIYMAYLELPRPDCGATRPPAPRPPTRILAPKESATREGGVVTVKGMRKGAEEIGSTSSVSTQAGVVSVLRGLCAETVLRDLS